MRVRPCHDSLGIGEGGSLLGQPVRSEHLLGDRNQRATRELAVADAPEERLQLATPEPVLGSACTPVLPQFAEINVRSEEHTSELQSRENLVCRLLLEK